MKKLLLILTSTIFFESASLNIVIKNYNSDIDNLISSFSLANSNPLISPKLRVDLGRLLKNSG